MLTGRIKDIMKGYVVVEYKWVLLTNVSALIVVSAIVSVLAVWTVSSSKTVSTVSAATAAMAPAAKPKEISFKPVILDWMKNRSEMPEQVLSGIYDAAVKNANPDLILAICFVESGFNPAAKSSRGAVGLMGIRPSVWSEELKKQGIIADKRDLYMVANNIAAGSYVFGQYMAKTTNIEDALLQYVGGDSAYAGKVLQALGEIYLARIQSKEIM